MKSGSGEVVETAAGYHVRARLKSGTRPKTYSYRRLMEPLPEPREYEPIHPRGTDWRGLLRRIWAPIAAVVGVAIKFGVVFAKFASIFVAVGGYALLWGWQFGVGIVLLILVHELGHYIEARRLGFSPALPVFIPFLGAYVAIRDASLNPWQHAKIALAGPMLGGLHEHHLARVEVPERELDVQVGVDPLFVRQLDVEADGDAAGVLRAAVRRLHGARAPARDDREAGLRKLPADLTRLLVLGARLGDPRGAEDGHGGSPDPVDCLEALLELLGDQVDLGGEVVLAPLQDPPVFHAVRHRRP